MVKNEIIFLDAEHFGCFKRLFLSDLCCRCVLWFCVCFRLHRETLLLFFHSTKTHTDCKIPHKLIDVSWDQHICLSMSCDVLLPKTCLSRESWSFKSKGRIIFYIHIYIYVCKICVHKIYNSNVSIDYHNTTKENKFRVSIVSFK